MSYLSYRTENNCDPKGLPKVYFCCHPDDFQSHFYPITDEILETQYCSFWYPTDLNAVRDENFLQDLKEMQLFVMPVTSNLLKTNNPAIDIEFPFAIQHNIPVLPLIQESSIIDLFNQRCGELQFLDKYDKDETAIEYEKKLFQFLSSALLNDETVDKIKEAFEAYIFLSYRKKDRKYAQQLMKLIHQHEAYRDIAIWYDEFLTPGENFNDNIKEALMKSELFVMSVTPNLVNETNYIMTSEYPMARSEQKNILPVEMEATDHVLLKQEYDGIPDCVDPYIDEEFASALLDSLSKMNLKENEKTPEHTYLIGLAYLDGIDVEMDKEKGIQLITASANAEHLDAVNKLSKMYYYGISVKKDYEKALSWKRKFIRIMESKESLTRSEKFTYIKELHHLTRYIDTYRSASTFSMVLDDAKLKALDQEKRRYLETALHTAVLEDIEKRTPQILELLMTCYQKAGKHLNYLSETSRAQNYYESALAIAQRLAKKEKESKYVDLLSYAYRELATFYSDNTNPKKADYYYQKALEVLGTTNLSYNKLKKLVWTYIKAGKNYADLLIFEPMLPYAEKAYELCKQLEAEYPSMDVRKLLDRCISDLAYVYTNLGYQEKETTLLLERVNLTDKYLPLAKDEKDHSLLIYHKYQLLIKYYERIGDVANELHYKELEIDAQYQRALKEDEKKYETYYFLSRSAERLAQSYQKYGDYNNAQRCFKNAMYFLRQVIDQGDSRNSYLYLLVQLDLLNHMKEPNPSSELYKEILDMENEILAHPMHENEIRYLATSAHYIGTQYEEIGLMDWAEYQFKIRDILDGKIKE